MMSAIVKCNCDHGKKTFEEANVITVKNTQHNIVVIEFPIPDGIVFSLVMRFHIFHYRIIFSRILLSIHRLLPEW